MQEIRRDGDETFTDNATMFEIEEAIENKENERVVVHNSHESFVEAMNKFKRRAKGPQNTGR